MELSRKCLVCGKKKTYKTRAGYRKGKGTPCISCANSLKAGGTGNVWPKNGKKKCPECKKYKKLSEFYKYSDGHYHSPCNECKTKLFKIAWKESLRFKKYGITKEYYDDLYNKQKGRCKICDMCCAILVIDHDHSTNRVRGLICRACNTVLGLVLERQETLQNMVEYLRNNYGEVR